jgi:spore maturation protein SpmA
MKPSDHKAPASHPHSSIGVMNIFFFLFIGIGVVTAAGNGSMKEISDQSFESAKSAVTLAISLIGIMAFWLGMMKILECAGVVSSMARLISPILGRLFFDIPKGHPALGAIVLNISANIFGLGNAATPFGIRAMEELQKINPKKDTASHAMCLFLAINTSSVALLPLGVIGVRAAAGASDPAGIWIPTLIATLSSTFVGVLACLIFRMRGRSDQEATEAYYNERIEDDHSNDQFKSRATVPMKVVSFAIFMLFLFFIIKEFIRQDSAAHFLKGDFASFWFMPFLMLGIVSFGLFRGVRVYDAAVEGAKEGFSVAVRIIPFLVIILVAIGVFRTSGALSFIASYIAPYTMFFGLPPEVLPMAVLRPLSGSGAFAVMGELVTRDPDSYEAFVASVLMGSTETTFYVATVYFGAVGIMKFRYAILCGLLADITGIIVASLSSWWWFTQG